MRKSTPVPAYARVGTALIAAVAVLLGGSLLWAAPANSAPIGSAAKFVPLQPQRVLDTRQGLGAPAGKVAPRSSVDLAALGVGGVPTSGVSAVVYNVTITQTSGGGFVQVFPTGQSTPGAFSNINHNGAGATVAGLVTAPVGAGGSVTLYTEGGGHLLADVFGYYTTSGATSDGRYVALSPARILDTRSTPEPTPSPTPAPSPTMSPRPTPSPTSTAPANPGDTKNCTDFATQREAQDYFDMYYPFYGDVAQLDSDNDLIACEGRPALRAGVKVAPRSSVSLQVAGAGGVPTNGASAVALNVTATQATGPGFVQVIPSGGSTPIGSSSNINLTSAGQTIANLVVVPIGADGRVTLYSEGGAHLLADVAGYFTDTSNAVSTTGLFQAVEPGRLLDTRTTGSKPGDESSLTVNPLGRNSVPASGVSGVVLNLTAVGTTAPGFVQAFPTGRAVAGSSSNLNVTTRGQVIANSALATLGDGGNITLYASKSTHLIADVFGFYLGEGAVVAPGASPSVSPTPSAPPAGNQAALQGLVIAPHNTSVAYNRDSWPHWIDADSDCQDTRAEVLLLETRTPAALTSTGCSVSTGEWFDPYTGQTWTLASDVDVDHFVPLANAHVSGGFAWDTARKQAFANDLSDPDHLIAVEDNINQAKGASAPDQWKPPRTAYYCTYATNWTEVKKTWELTVTQAEYDALAQMLQGC